MGGKVSCGANWHGSFPLTGCDVDEDLGHEL